MAIADDISIDGARNIRRTGPNHAGAAGYYTVLELHRFLQDLADNQIEAGDDLVSIVRFDPSNKQTDNIIELVNGYNIDDDLAEYLFDGSIIQTSGDEIYDGFVNFGNTSFIMIVQNGVVLKANDYWNENGGLNPDSFQGISHRFMLKVRTAGADIDGRRVLGMSREFGNSYAEFNVNGTSRGNNVFALSEATDLNNQTAAGTVATWSDVTNTEGHQLIDLNNGQGNRPYYSQWNFGSRTVNQYYERLKWLTREGSAETLYGLDGDLFRGITHQIDIDNVVSTFNSVEPISWAGGTGQLLGIDSPNRIWMQLLTGVAPTDNQSISGGTSGASADVNVAVITRTISSPFVGQSTGTAILGAYGLGIEAADLTVRDSLTDLDGTAQAPPNQQSFSVLGLVIGEDRVLVGPQSSSGLGVLGTEVLHADGAQGSGATTLLVKELIPAGTPASGSIRFWDGSDFIAVGYTNFSVSTFTLSGTLGGAGVSDGGDVFADFQLTSSGDQTAVATTFVINESIPSDTPTSGAFFVYDGVSYQPVLYSSYSASTFTLTTTLGHAIEGGAPAFIAYIDVLAAGTTESFIYIYSSDRPLYVKVRDGGGTPIKSFESPAVAGSAGGSITAIRTSDA